MDLTDSIAPKSDQLNAEDLLTGPRTFTEAVSRFEETAADIVATYATATKDMPATERTVELEMIL